MIVFELLDFVTHETLVVNDAKKFYPQKYGVLCPYQCFKIIRLVIGISR